MGTQGCHETVGSVGRCASPEKTHNLASRFLMQSFVLTVREICDRSVTVFRNHPPIQNYLTSPEQSLVPSIVTFWRAKLCL